LSITASGGRLGGLAERTESAWTAVEDRMEKGYPTTLSQQMVIREAGEKLRQSAADNKVNDQQYREK
jgi:hypothetical protein